MNLKFVILIALITTNIIYGQVDRHGNPVFNSIQISAEEIDDFELTSSYYTIDNNISNKESSVYLSDNPTLDEYIRFARELPSLFFIVHQEQNIRFMIGLLQTNEGVSTSFNYMVINTSNNERIEQSCNVIGEISEKRVEELLKLQVDTAAKIISKTGGESFLFNGKVYKIQPYDEVKTEVIEIAKHLINPDTDKNENIEDYIRKETIGGKLDFKKILDEE